MCKGGGGRRSSSARANMYPRRQGFGGIWPYVRAILRPRAILRAVAASR